VTQSLESVDPSPFDVDMVYLQQTLRHEPMELGLDDSVSLRTLGILLVRAYLVSLLVFIVFLIIFGLAAINSRSAGLLSLPVLAGIVTFLIVVLGSKVTEPIGEWRTLLPNRAGQAESYYRVIAAVLRRRDLPIIPQLRRVQLNTPGRPVKHAMVLSEDAYQTYVTVFAYGTSLYVGWQMWRRRSGGQLIRRALVDRVTAANLVTSMLRTDRARAVREAVHLACREAVYATADESLWALAQQLPLPQVELETALLQPAQPQSPVLPPPSAVIPAPAATTPAAPTYVATETPAPTWTEATGETPHA
jgi:hypothetical protein